MANKCKLDLNSLQINGILSLFVNYSHQFICACLNCFELHSSINLLPLIWGRGGSCLSRDTRTSRSETHRSVLGLPRGLLPAGHARNTSRGRHPWGLRPHGKELSEDLKKKELLFFMKMTSAITA